MIDTKKIFITVEGTGKDPFEANYCIKKQRAHLFIHRDHDIRSWISRASGKEPDSGKELQLFDCYLLSAGDDYDEYVTKRAFVNESKTSYATNSYLNSLFTLSNDFLRFFKSVWKIEPVTSDSHNMNFEPLTDRVEQITFSTQASMSIKRGYRQSYSKIRYEAHVSIAFFLHYQDEVPRETILADIQQVSDYFSLFCKHFVRIGEIRLQKKGEEQQIGYFGEPAEDVSEVNFFSNPLIEQQDIDGYSNQSLIDWMSLYEKAKVCVNLMRDADKLTDDQLKFICYSRALEVFHKEFFVDADKESVAWFDNLFDFVSTNGLTTVAKSDFVNPNRNITLTHRLYDLARYGFSLFTDRDFTFVFGYVVKKDRIQQLADTRNYLIHFSESKRAKAWKTEDLHHLNFNMYMMLKVLFLKQIGFSEKAIRSVVRTFERNYFGQ
jgi:hypothetical protein